MAKQARSMNVLNAVTILAVVLGALLYLGSSALQQFLIYHPDHRRITPIEVGLNGVEEVELNTPDGNTLIAWFAQASAGQPTVLYFHGNAGGLAGRGLRLQRLNDAGFGVLILSYRGYSGSTGRPTERDNVADGKRAFNYLVEEKGLSADDIFLFGESLGTGVAVQVAAAKAPAGVILDAPYTSMLDLAHLHYPYLPAGWLLKDRYETKRYIGKMKSALLIVHGDQDQVIPDAMGRAVFKAAEGAQSKQFIMLSGVGHLDHDELSFGKIIAWIKRAHAAANPAAGKKAM